MADKKVNRQSPYRGLSPAQQAKNSLSDEGTIEMSDPTHDKGRSALVDKSRDREERWRRRQATKNQEEAGAE